MTTVNSTTTIIFCRICAARSTGLHYDVRTCDACAAFFRRSIAENRRYTCEYDRQCSIVYNAQNVRKMCKYCRLKKCFTVGLRADGIRRSIPNDHHRPANIVQLAPSVYCKPRSELNYLDKLLINRRSINSYRYHRYMWRPTEQCKSADMIYVNDRLHDFKNQQMIKICETKLIDDFLFENEFYDTISIDDKSRLLHDYTMMWFGSEHAIVTVRHGGVDQNCSYFLDGTHLALTHESLRKFYSNSDQINDPDMMARLSLCAFQYHTNTVARAFQSANLDETETVALLALLYTTNYNSVSTDEARRALLNARKRILSELWRHYQSAARCDPSMQLASLIFLVDPIQTCASYAKEFVYAMSIGANREMSWNLGKALNSPK